MDQDAIIQYVTDTFTGVDVVRPTDGPGADDTFFIYDPRRDLEPRRQFPFATIVTKDYGDFAQPHRRRRVAALRAPRFTLEVRSRRCRSRAGSPWSAAARPASDGRR